MSVPDPKRTPIGVLVCDWVRRLGLESPNFFVTGTDCLPERPIRWRAAKMVLHFAALAHRFAWLKRENGQGLPKADISRSRLPSCKPTSEPISPVANP